MPVWEAQYVVVIASKTGWTEYHIRWDLPYTRGYAYFHTSRVLEGERCRWPGIRSAVGRWIDEIHTWWRKRRP